MNISKVVKKYMPIIIIGFSFLLAAIFTSLKKDEKKKAVDKHIPTIKTFDLKSFFWPVAPIFFKIICLEYLSICFFEKAILILLFTC